MSGVRDTIDSAVELGKKAVTLDQEGKHEGAAYFYEQAALVLERLTISNPSLPGHLTSKAAEYKQRAASLRCSRKRNFGSCLLLISCCCPNSLI